MFRHVHAMTLDCGKEMRLLQENSLTY